MARRQQAIYVVDDDPAVLHSTRFLLENEGYRVEAFASGRDLLAAFPGASPALVILDHVMPEMDGIEVFGRLRALGVHSPIVLVTGHPAASIRARAGRAGLPLLDKQAAGDAILGMLAADGRRPGASAPGHGVSVLDRQPAAGSRGRGGFRGSAQGAARGDGALSPIRLA